MPAEKVFDELGNEIPGEGAPPPTEAIEEQEESDAVEAAGDEESPAAGKYRIGDQSFNTLAEAQAFATQAVQQGDQNAAYRRLVDEIVAAKPSGESVTQTAPKIDEEKLWANPGEFLTNFAKEIREQAVQEVGTTLHQQRVQAANDDAIFGEFTARHPDLADFRQEVEQFTAQNRAVVGNLANTKGRTAAYDYVALHLRERFNKYAEAAKPRRVLRNSANGAPPAGRGTGVTPPRPKNKPLSLAEQIRTIKKVKR